MTAVPATTRAEPWPIWAQVLLVAIALLAFASILPWLAMSSTMAATCGPMMGEMNRIWEMMRPGMMR